MLGRSSGRGASRARVSSQSALEYGGGSGSSSPLSTRSRTSRVEGAWKRGLPARGRVWGGGWGVRHSVPRPASAAPWVNKMHRV